MSSSVLSAVIAVGLDPQKLLESLGLIGLFAIVFAESGILIGFFLPGDSLLFTAGLATYGITFSDGGDVFQLANGNIAVVVIGVVLAAIAGDQVGYAFGRKVGPALFTRPESRLFKPSYVESAEKFFAKHGSKSIVLARFVPIVRTFTPIVAGVSNMHYSTFVRFNIIGGVIWGAGLTLIGYTLGRTFPAIGDNIEIAVLVIVVVSLLPIAIEFLRHRRSRGQHAG
jgi:membrane-associated protein